MASVHRKTIRKNHDYDGVISYLEPDMLECEVKWALGSTTVNKSSGGDGIPVERFQILKNDVFFIIGDWNAKVGSQEIPGVTDKFDLGVQN